ncbi:hypothetical protein FBEOM_502 [Fusarium beomiforme]|uniref:Major facilitator superfamily (MFS) profile domain-containing protein n=1 Tax=Fusarium beomiforme TaxID=44412 RepID=A0A9P5E1S5_9HYPO|nr:hypothetical protein FBEOM_502 [Fusarium beomiforme]
MDAHGSFLNRNKLSPESIPSTGLSVIYEPEADAPIVDIILVHGLKGHPYKTWRCKQTAENSDKQSTYPGKDGLKSSTSKRLELRQSIKAFVKGSSSKSRHDSSLTPSTVHNVTTPDGSDSTVFWPVDLLPQVCQKARILTFGYDTKITKFTSGPTNANSIFSHGKDFLFALRRETVRCRPIIFIAHSLGGILVKEMLALSSTTEASGLKGIIESTAAVVFLGTPHRGSPDLSAIGEWARSMLSGLHFQTTSTILDTLGLKTTDLERAHEAFCRLWYQYDFQVKTFQESFGLTGIDLGVLGNKVVPHESSLIGDPREHAETLQANHKQMSRFSSAHDPNYVKVAGEIKVFYDAIHDAQAPKRCIAESNDAIKMKQGRYGGLQRVYETPNSKSNLPDSLDQNALRKFLAALPFDKMNARRESILSPSLNTGNWLFRNETFHLWNTTTDWSQRLFLIKGKPGAGKSTLMNETVRHMQCMYRGDGICASFFIDAAGEHLQRCASGIFRSLLYQLLSQSDICSPGMNLEKSNLISRIKAGAPLSSLDWTEQYLENLLAQTLEYLSYSGIPVFIFVDAVDELGYQMQRHQVDFWSELLHSPYIQNLRICLSCRHFPNVTVTGCLALALDAHNKDDISNYIKQRLDARISLEEGDWIKVVTEKIQSLSCGVFLWVVLMVDDILASYDEGASLLRLIRQVERTPRELEDLYIRMLTFTRSSERQLAGRMLQWVFAANRPLRLDEWNHILAFIQDPKPNSLAEWRESENYIENDGQLERKIKSISRGLLEVSTKQVDVLAEKNGEVSSINAGVGSLDHEEGSARVVRLIHHSVYDFFMHKGGFMILGLESLDPLGDCHCTIINTYFDYLLIPELDEYILARQRVNMASMMSSSFSSLDTGEAQNVHDVTKRQGSKYSPEGLETQPTWNYFQIVENWLAEGSLSSCAGSITSHAAHSVSRQSVGMASKVLDDYPALLVYITMELMLHIEYVDFQHDPTKAIQELINRLKENSIWIRLRALQQEKHMRQMEDKWVEAMTQSLLPSIPSKFFWASIGASPQSDLVPGCLTASSIMGVFTKFRFFNRRLALSCVLIAVSTFNYGFDNQAFATTQAMDSFDKQFGVLNAKTGKYVLEPYWLSLFNSLNYIGFAAGVLSGTWISSRWGRRWCMFVMSIYALGTATIAVTSFHREQIMAARILNYVYVGMELGVVPTFQSEIVPAQARGFMVGSYQLSLAIGGLVINSICYGTSSLPDNRAWRIPLGMFYIVPSIVIAGIWFVPESPRWLLRKNRVEEARNSLEKIREGVFTYEEIEAEFTELRVSLEEETEQGRFVELFRGINLKRTLIVVAANFFQQAGGQAFVSQYGTIYVKSLGTINPFGFSLITSSIGIVTIICILLWTDIIGRRVLMIASSVTMFAAMVTMGSLGIQTPVDDSRKKGVISMMAVFASGFGMGWAPLVYVVTTEISALRLRDLTSRVGFTVNVIMNFAVNFSIPYLIYDKYAGLNSKVGFIFGGIMATAIVFVFFCVPECTGKTLEQVDFLFNQGVPTRQFGKVDAAEMMRAAQREDDLGKLRSDNKDNSVTAEQPV